MQRLQTRNLATLSLRLRQCDNLLDAALLHRAWAPLVSSNCMRDIYALQFDGVPPTIVFELLAELEPANLRHLSLKVTRLPENAVGKLLQIHPVLESLDLRENGLPKAWPPERPAQQTGVSSEHRPPRLPTSTNKASAIHALDSTRQLAHFVLDCTSQRMVVPCPLRWGTTLRSLTIGQCEVSREANVAVPDTLPLLENLEILPKCPPSLWVPLVTQIRAPILRNLRLEAPSAHAARLNWRSWHELYPMVEELRLHLIGVSDIVEATLQFKNLRTLQISSSSIPPDFLDRAEDAWPHLVSLDVSNACDVTSSQVMRFVKAKIGQIEELNVDGCVKLHKEAVDWLRSVVPRVRFTGWQDRSEVRIWKG